MRILLRELDENDNYGGEQIIVYLSTLSFRVRLKWRERAESVLKQAQRAHKHNDFITINMCCVNLNTARGSLVWVSLGSGRMSHQP